MPADRPIAFPSTIFEKTARWFERAGSALLGQLPCRPGCHRCCIGSFPVTLLDREEIQRGLRTLPARQRLRICETAAAQTQQIEQHFPQLTRNKFLDHRPDDEIDRIVEQCGTLPCPALETDGTCGLYAYRPLTCRSMGIPTEDAGVVQGACDIQTSIPLIRLSPALRHEEDQLAKEEAVQLNRLCRQLGAAGEELLLPYAFLQE